MKIIHFSSIPRCHRDAIYKIARIIVVIDYEQKPLEQGNLLKGRKILSWMIRIMN